MKRVILLSLLLLLVVFAGCNKPVEEKAVYDPNAVSVEKEAEEEVVEEEPEVDYYAKFNSNLEDFEQEWLDYLEDKYEGTKIFHFHTKDINCDDCYEVWFKKDFQIVKIKVMNGEKVSENKVTKDIAPEIQDSEVCDLFRGTWNPCPSVCNTDEEACATVCGLPVCEFDYNTFEYVDEGGSCGGMTNGECDFGLTCVFADPDDATGTCVKE